MRALRLALVAVMVLALGFAAVTYVALESGGVVTVRTTAADGAPRETHVWFVRNADGLFLEAGHPQNPWVRDLASLQTLALTGGGLDGEYRFAVDPEPAGHRRIRALMREKYGWRDWWVELLFDTSASRLVALTPS